MRVLSEELQKLVEKNQDTPREALVLLAAELTIEIIATEIVKQADTLTGCKESSN